MTIYDTCLNPGTSSYITTTDSESTTWKVKILSSVGTPPAQTTCAAPKHPMYVGSKVLDRSRVNFSQSSQDVSSTTPSKAVHVADRIKRGIERFANASRTQSHGSTANEQSPPRIELRRSSSSPAGLQLREAICQGPSRLQMSMEDDAEYFMAKDHHPFITTPGWMEEP